jgi:hypothetical protein
MIDLFLNDASLDLWPRTPLRARLLNVELQRVRPKIHPPPLIITLEAPSLTAHLSIATAEAGLCPHPGRAVFLFPV